MSASGSGPRWGWRLLLGAAVIAGILYFVFVGLRPVAVVATVARGRAVNAVPGSVEVLAEFTAELRCEVGGRITSSIVDPGLHVKKGEVLVQIDTGDVDLEIEKIQNQIVADRRKVEVGSTLRADVLNMRDTVSNYEHLVKLGSYPAIELEKQRRTLQQLEQRADLDDVNTKLTLDTDENALKTKLREKEKMTITAPADGVISTVNLNARAGDLIARDTPIATLISSTRTVEARISEENFAGIQVGQKASVTFLGYGNKLYHASVIKVLPTANAETQRYLVHLELSDLAEEKLVPGLTGEVSIVIGERDAAAIIPRRALRGNQVFVVNGGVIELRTVELGYTSLNDVEILKGLTEGEQVVVEDLDRYRPGQHVRTKPLK